MGTRWSPTKPYLTVEKPVSALLLGQLPGLREPSTCRYFNFFFFETRIRITTIKIDSGIDHEELRQSKMKFICREGLRIFANTFVVMRVETVAIIFKMMRHLVLI